LRIFTRRLAGLARNVTPEEPLANSRLNLVVKPAQPETSEPQALPPVNTARPMFWGVGVIFLGLVAVLVWAATAPIGSAVVTIGTIATEGNKRTVQHLEGGIVSEILVRDDMLVNEGDILVRFEQTRARAQFNVVRDELDANEALEARLLAERDDRPSIVWPKRLTEGTGDLKLGEILATQKAIFTTRRESMVGQKKILQQRIEQILEQITGLRALEKSKITQVRLIKEELSDLKGLLAEGLVTKTRVLALEREAARLEGEIGDHRAAIARAEQGIGETRYQILQLENNRREEIAGQLRDAQEKIFQYREQIVTSQDVLRRTEIRAPVSGTVIGLTVHTLGAVIAPGGTLMSIVPVNDRLIVEAQIPPPEIDGVVPGLPVTIRFVNVDSKLTPVINGTLDTVSADRLTDPRTGAPYYLGRVTIPESEVRQLGHIKPQAGMAVDVMINRGERTVLDYALRPMTDRLSRAFRER